MSVKGLFGGAGKPVMGHSVRASSYQATRCRRCSGVTGRRFVRRTTGWCQAVRGPGSPLQIVSASDEVRVELAGDVALQGAHDLAGGASFREATRDVFAGAFIAGHAREHDPPERVV